MADDTLHHRGDPVLHGALERFERAEAELEETEDRRRRLADEAARAAAELESTLDHAIKSSLVERDRLEDELAAVLDHIARLESIRARSVAREADVAVVAGAGMAGGPAREISGASQPTDGDDATDYAEQWSELMKSRGDGAIAS